MATESKPLSALLSQSLVACTVELDCEFELRSVQLAGPGARLSLVVWFNLLRFFVEAPLTVRALAERALADEQQIKHQLACLERWGFVQLQPGRRPGFGSTKGIRADWLIRLTDSGQAAIGIWPQLLTEIDRRWLNRFGECITSLRRSLEQINREIDLELPLGLPGAILKLPEFGPRKSAAQEGLPLPALLSRVLLAFALEFERQSPTPISLCANAIRILGDDPIPEAEISRRTGCSAETAGIGWQLKPYIIVNQDPARGRGKFVRLSQAGIIAQHNYHRIARSVEARWSDSFAGASNVLRDSLQTILNSKKLSQGLQPPPGTTRADTFAPALGRRKVGPAARQRIRDLVNQTEAFVRDPSGALPHYPLWDMNRGFGP